MSEKIVLSDVASGYNRQKINDNFQKIEQELNDKVLYRDNPDGEPNQMENDLDMNSNRILNLLDAIEDTEPVTLRQFLKTKLNFGDPSVFLTEETDFSVDGTDFGKLYWTVSDTPVTVTLASEGSGFIPDGEAVYFLQGGLGAIDFIAGDGVTILSADLMMTRSQNSLVTAIRLSDTHWVLAGDLGFYV